METKKCETCFGVFPATTEYFYVNHGCGNLRNRCKECFKKEMSAYYHKNHPKVPKAEVEPIVGKVDCPGMKFTGGKCFETTCRYHMLEGTGKNKPSEVSAAKYTCLFEVTETFPEGLNQKQISDIMGLSQQRINQLEARALAKLREIAGGMEEFLYEEPSNRYQKPRATSKMAVSEMMIVPIGIKRNE